MKFISTIIFALLFTTVAHSQSPSKILKQAEKALGGTKALQSVHTVTGTGSIKRVSDGALGKFLYRTMRPNLYDFGFDMDRANSEIAYNGRSGWLWSTHDGLKTLTGNSIANLQAKAAFRNAIWLNYKNERSKIVSGGTAKVDGKTANVLILTTQKGVAIKLFFDASSGLPLRDEIPNSEFIEYTDFSDYRNIGGVKFAFFNRVTIDNEMFEISFDSIQINSPIEKSVFDFPNLSGKPLPDVPALFKELQANEDKIDSLLDSYSFNQKTIMRELGKDGVLREKESETNQLSFYKGFRIKRLIEKNGKPLNENDRAEADKDAAKQAEDIEKRIAKNEARTGKLDSKGAPSQDSRRISIAEILRASKLLNPRRERFRGRDCVVFDFEPNPEFDTKNSTSVLRFFGKTAGVMWIDEKDNQVARIEAALFESISFGGGVLAKFKKGATFTLDKERINDEIWLPSQADINFSARVLLFKGIDINQVEKFYDYQKFDTQVKDAKVDGAVIP
jgi:hypothetical protein